MSEHWLAVLIVAVTTWWLLTGVATALRDRLAARIAQWLLPEGQAWTYRIARGVCRLALLIAPQRQLCIYGIEQLVIGEPPVLLSNPVEWDSPRAALAELEVNARNGEHVAHPIGLVPPLVARALTLRWRNLSERMSHALIIGMLLPSFVRRWIAALPSYSLRRRRG